MAVAPALVADLRGDARPQPPEDLTEEQGAEWRAVMDRLPADWFPRETHGLVAQYCRHVSTAQRLARLLAAQERETRCIASLATRMRMSQQATYDKSKEEAR
jgi:hypothetical protein